MNKLISKQITEINHKLSGNKGSDDLINTIDNILLEVYAKDENGFYIFRNSISKASKLACELYNQKPFARKNLSTAIYTALVLLQINGIALSGYDNDLDTLKKYISNNDNISMESWINKYILNNTI